MFFAGDIEPETAPRAYAVARHGVTIGSVRIPAALTLPDGEPVEAWIAARLTALVDIEGYYDVAERLSGGLELH